jgi:hypothetical protein
VLHALSISSSLTYHSNYSLQRVPQTWTDYLDKRPKLKKTDARFCTWNVRSLYRAGSLMTVKGKVVPVLN